MKNGPPTYTQIPPRKKEALPNLVTQKWGSLRPEMEKITSVGGAAQSSSHRQRLSCSSRWGEHKRGLIFSPRLAVSSGSSQECGTNPSQQFPTRFSPPLPIWAFSTRRLLPPKLCFHKGAGCLNGRQFSPLPELFWRLSKYTQALAHWQRERAVGSRSR